MRVRTEELMMTFPGTAERATANVRAALTRAMLGGAALAALGLGAATAQDAAPAGSGVQHDLVNNFCLECHNFEDWAGGVAYDTMDLDDVGSEPEIWETAVTKLRGRLMPPAGEPQPDQADVDAVVDYLEASLDAAAAQKAEQIGHVPIQRLNRTEYAVAVKDLIGVDLDPNQILPTEIEVDGFDNIADAQAMSPSFLEQYVSTAIHAARDAVGETSPKFASVRYVVSIPNQTGHQDGFPLGTRGGFKFTHVFPTDGEYHFNIQDVDAGLYPRGMETDSTLVLLVDGREAFRVNLGGPDDLALADRDGPEGRAAIVKKVSDMPAEIEAGAHEVTLTFIDRSRALSNDASGGGLVSRVPRILGGVVVEGPFNPAGLSMSASRAKIFICQPQSEAEERPCAERIAQSLATRAFRRPVTDADLAWLMPFYDSGRAEDGVFDAGVRDMVSAILASPDFLYRAIEAEPDAPRALDDLELASRLSFFLWSQGPDAELIDLASQHRLSDPQVLSDEVDRMLADPRAQALVEDFALSWLNLDELEQVEPQDPRFNDAMRENFKTEIRLFLASVLLEDRPVSELLSADYTFVNDALAQQYGIPGVFGPQFREVHLDDPNRWGLLGKGAVLLRTSYGDRTSPVLRGKWVLDRLMGTAPTDPPPNVVTDLSIHDGEIPTTVRARLEKHRTDPNCNACHGLIDPLGLAMENFDNTGRWRDVDEQAHAPIDATTELSSGQTLHGPIELRDHLLRRPDQFAMSVTKRAMMYALNREINYYDMPEVRAIVRDAAEHSYTFASIVHGIVDSDAFRMQGPEDELMQKAELETDAPQTP